MLALALSRTDKQYTPPTTSKTGRGAARDGQHKMHLMYYTDAEGKRVYTLKKENPAGKVTYSAHPGTCDRACMQAGRGWVGLVLMVCACGRPCAGTPCALIIPSSSVSTD